MKSISRCFWVLLITVIGADFTFAAPITYTITTTATGSLGGTQFTDAAVTMTFAGDTSNIFGGDTVGGPAYIGTLGELGTGTVIVAGLGAATLTDPAFILSTFDNTTVFGQSGVIIGDNTNGTGILSAVGSVFYGYDLATSYGPVAAGGGLGNGGGPGNTFPTSAGILEFPRDQPPPDVGSIFTAVTTQSLTGYQGGTTAAPVYLVGGAPIGELTGIISGVGAEDYYSFYWGGGVFAATASITNAPSGASYVFSAGAAGSCNSVGSETLNSGDGYSDIISTGNLPAGQYCIGVDANNGNDPDFSLTFDTPVNGTPEPGTFLLLSGGLAVIARARRTRKARS